MFNKARVFLSFTFAVVAFAVNPTFAQHYGHSHVGGTSSSFNGNYGSRNGANYGSVPLNYGGNAYGHGHSHGPVTAGHSSGYYAPARTAPIYPYAQPSYRWPSTPVVPAQPRWHDTTHLDYHPGSVIQHGNHGHVTQGHYDVHSSGHFHN